MRMPVTPAEIDALISFALAEGLCSRAEAGRWGGLLMRATTDAIGRQPHSGVATFLPDLIRACRDYQFAVTQVPDGKTALRIVMDWLDLVAPDGEIDDPELAEVFGRIECRASSNATGGQA